MKDLGIALVDLVLENSGIVSEKLNIIPENPVLENLSTALKDPGIAMEDSVLEDLGIVLKNLGIALKDPGTAPKDSTVGVNRGKVDGKEANRSDTTPENQVTEDLTVVEDLGIAPENPVAAKDLGIRGNPQRLVIGEQRLAR